MIASLLIVVLVHTTSLVGFTPSPAKCRSIGAIRCRGKHILISLLAFSRHTFFNQAFLEKMPYLILKCFPDCAEVPPLRVVAGLVHRSSAVTLVHARRG